MKKLFSVLILLIFVGFIGYSGAVVLDTALEDNYKISVDSFICRLKN